MNVAIVGSRTLTNFDKSAILKHIPEEATDIISGGAMGIDTLAEEIAHDRKLNFVKLVPQYDVFGATAPLVRNAAIVERADYVLAVWDFQSRGTAHVIAQCIEKRVPIRIIDASGRERQ